MYLTGTSTFDGPIAIARATNILDIQLDNYNDVMYFLDVYHHRLYIRKITNYSKPSAVVTTLYNLSILDYSTTTTGDLTTTDITFANVGSFFVENENKIYLVSPGVIRKIEGNFVSIVAGDYSPGTNSDLSGYTDGNGTSSRFNGIFDIIEDANKNLIITDSGNNRIRKISFE
jgi:hypothetical protein